MSKIIFNSSEFAPRPWPSVSGCVKDGLKMSGVKYFFVFVFVLAALGSTRRIFFLLKY